LGRRRLGGVRGGFDAGGRPPIARCPSLPRLQYVDRGVVPGAFESLGTYIQQDIGRSDTDTFTGALQSAFIGGYSVASISFGHLVHKYPPFRLMSVGLGIWVIAVVLSGLAPYLLSHNSFWILISARVLSGVGEASFQTVVPPYIDDNAPADKRGLWLSIFYMAIPVGTASERGRGVVVAHTHQHPNPNPHSSFTPFAAAPPVALPGCSWIRVRRRHLQPHALAVDVLL